MNSRKNKLSIVSGGQSGVERAALDFALCNELDCSGWCAMGRVADDGFIPYRYPLHEVFSEDFINRTLQNVLDSEGLLIIVHEDLDDLTQLAFDVAIDNQRPVFIWKISNNRNYRIVNQWIENENVKFLNVTGPSETKVPGIHEETLDLLGNFFPDLVC